MIVVFKYQAKAVADKLLTSTYAEVPTFVHPEDSAIVLNTASENKAPNSNIQVATYGTQSRPKASSASYNKENKITYNSGEEVYESNNVAGYILRRPKNPLLLDDVKQSYQAPSLQSFASDSPDINLKYESPSTGYIINDPRSEYKEYSIKNFVSSYNSKDISPLANQYKASTSGEKSPVSTYDLPSSKARIPLTEYKTPSLEYEIPSSDYTQPTAISYQTPSTDYDSPFAGKQDSTSAYKQRPAKGLNLNYDVPNARYNTPRPRANLPSEYEAPTIDYKPPPSLTERPNIEYELPSLNFKQVLNRYKPPETPSLDYNIPTSKHRKDSEEYSLPSTNYDLPVSSKNLNENYDLPTLNFKQVLNRYKPSETSSLDYNIPTSKLRKDSEEYSLPSTNYELPDSSKNPNVNYDLPTLNFKQVLNRYKPPENLSLDYSLPTSKHKMDSEEKTSSASDYNNMLPKTPNSQYDAPSIEYSTPTLNKVTLSSNYNTPVNRYNTPSSDYEPPTKEYKAPNSDYSVPIGNINSEEQYGEPSTEYQSPHLQIKSEYTGLHKTASSYGIVPSSNNKHSTSRHHSNMSSKNKNARHQYMLPASNYRTPDTQFRPPPSSSYAAPSLSKVNEKYSPNSHEHHLPEEDYREETALHKDEFTVFRSTGPINPLHIYIPPPLPHRVRIVTVFIKLSLASMRLNPKPLICIS